jgi:hypothetical protein
MYNELQRMSKETAVAKFKLLPLNFREETLENYKKD